MPKNRAIYFSLLLIAASALLFLGWKLTEYVSKVLPYTTAVGILGLIVAVFYEAQAKKNASPNSERPNP